MSKLKKEIRCKKCNKLIAFIEENEISIQGKIKGKISKGKYSFECTGCKKVIKGTIK